MGSHVRQITLALLVALLLNVPLASAQELGPQTAIAPQANVGSASTYQGRLTDGDSPGVGVGLYARGNVDSSADVIVGGNENTTTGDDDLIQYPTSAILDKALGILESGTGVIEALITLYWPYPYEQPATCNQERSLHMKTRIYVPIALILALLIVPTAALAQSGGDYDLSWSTIDGGGGVSSGGDYTLQGTIGQADAGTVSGGDYTLSGGFWPGAGGNYRIYLPLVLRNPA